MNIVKEKDAGLVIHYFGQSKDHIKETRRRQGRKSHWHEPAEAFKCCAPNSKLITLTSFHWEAFIYYSSCEHLTQVTSNSHSDIELITFTMGIIWTSTVAATFDHVCHISQANLWIQVATMAESPKDYRKAASKASVISLWCSALGMFAFNSRELAQLMYQTD